MEIPVDEINLAYVAVTRARKRVFLNASLARLLLFPAQPLAYVDDGGRADPSRHFEHAESLNDHGFAPYVLRYVDLPADEKPNRLHWNPALSAFGRGDACQKCGESLDASNAFVLPPSDATRTDGLVCVGDRGAELRNIDPFHEGVLEDEDDAARNPARDAGHVRLDVDRRYHRARDTGSASLPGIFVFENPPFSFARARVATASIPTPSPLGRPPGTVAAPRLARRSFTPFTASVSFARPRARAPISPPPPSPDRSSSRARASINHARTLFAPRVSRASCSKSSLTARARHRSSHSRARAPSTRASSRPTSRLARSTRLFSRHPSRHASPSRRRRRRRTRRRRARRRERARRAANHFGIEGPTRARDDARASRERRRRRRRRIKRVSFPRETTTIEDARAIACPRIGRSNRTRGFRAVPPWPGWRTRARRRRRRACARTREARRRERGGKRAG